MKLSGGMLSRLRDRLIRLRPELAPRQMRVTNLTRQTTLATNVEVADSSARRRKGLLGRAGLSAGEGLWIVPCESVHTIGMQFPIDIVYLNRRHRITKIRSSVPAWRLSICLCAHSVLELAAGAIRETQTERGDQLEFSPISVPSGNENSSSAEQVNKTNG